MVQFDLVIGRINSMLDLGSWQRAQSWIMACTDLRKSASCMEGALNPQNSHFRTSGTAVVVASCLLLHMWIECPYSTSESQNEIRLRRTHISEKGGILPSKCCRYFALLFKWSQKNLSIAIIVTSNAFHWVLMLLCFPSLVCASTAKYWLPISLFYVSGVNALLLWETFQDQKPATEQDFKASHDSSGALHSGKYMGFYAWIQALPLEQSRREDKAEGFCR